jgi:hypothetical protein
MGRPNPRSVQNLGSFSELCGSFYNGGAFHVRPLPAKTPDRVPPQNGGVAMRHSLTILLVLLVGSALSACGDDDNAPFGPGGVGGLCRSDRDCGSGVCEESFCTFRCEHDAHCGPGTACINEHGGICAALCNSDPECGPGFECRSSDRRGVDGSIAVCRG